MGEFSVVILAGGTSSRMGEEKGLLSFRGTSMIEYILSQVRDLAAETLIIANDLEAYKHIDIPIRSDIEPGLGALGGLYSALSYATHYFVLVLACDMPFVNRRFYEHLMSLAPDYDAVVPNLKSGRREPFRSVYSKSCLGPIRSAIDSGKRRATSFLPFIRVRYLEEDEVKRFDPPLFSFFNVNSPEDYARAEQIASKFPI
ncbi:MAG: molybdenum cofactor guanylyltransferase [Anaerolineales bacterium]